ncbi:unnamed protein product [Caenorhabditis auriculariae]|uniref:Uncharacterized protein n=1 Tax=Caenorhabditis auriculariae TaxID=2777116 RepID=A0A8S1HPU9_9PELO|nr:unnamed protein product [Caenorhabditis auriculariae]
MREECERHAAVCSPHPHPKIAVLAKTSESVGYRFSAYWLRSNIQLPAITSFSNLYRLMRKDIPERDEFSTAFEIVAIGTTPYIDALATEIPDKFQALFVYDKTATPETVKALASKAKIPVIFGRVPRNSDPRRVLLNLSPIMDKPMKAF